MDFIFIIFGVIVFVARVVFEQDGKDNAFYGKSSGSQDKIKDLFRSVNKANTEVANNINSTENRAVFNEASDQLKSRLYFAIFKVLAGLMLIAVFTVIYIQIVS